VSGETPPRHGVQVFETRGAEVIFVPSEFRRLPLIRIDFDEDHRGHQAEVLLKQAPEPDECVFVSDLNLRGPDPFLDLDEERSGVLFRDAPRAALLHEVSSGVDCP
jgi:hypothetical protein